VSAPASARAFIAVALPAALRQALGQVNAGLRRTVPEGAVRWVRPEGMHLTLKFLGDMPLSQAEQVQTMLEAAAREAAPFECDVSGLGCFPNLRQPRVVWAGLREPSGALAHLQRAVEAGAVRLGYTQATGDRGFMPHLTLGRVARQAGAAEWRSVAEAVQAAAAGEIGTFLVEAVCLMKSDLRPGGSAYTRLFRAGLG
jgi:2'-5' RNA ligase